MKQLDLSEEIICRFATREACDTACPARDLCHIGHNGLVELLDKEAEDD